MAKEKPENKKTKKAEDPKAVSESNAKEQEILSKLPKEAQEKLKEIKIKLDKFQKRVLEKFDKYIMGIALLPPPKLREGEKPPEKEKISVLVLVDDSDSQKMSKYELKQKINTINDSIAKDIDPNIKQETIILSELWQSCYDAKYDLIQLVALAA